MRKWYYTLLSLLLVASVLYYLHDDLDGISFKEYVSIFFELPHAIKRQAVGKNNEMGNRIVSGWKNKERNLKPLTDPDDPATDVLSEDTVDDLSANMPADELEAAQSSEDDQPLWLGIFLNKPNFTPLAEFSGDTWRSTIQTVATIYNEYANPIEDMAEYPLDQISYPGPKSWYLYYADPWFPSPTGKKENGFTLGNRGFGGTMGPYQYVLGFETTLNTNDYHGDVMPAFSRKVQAYEELYQWKGAYDWDGVELIQTLSKKQGVSKRLKKFRFDQLKDIKLIQESPYYIFCLVGQNDAYQQYFGWYSVDVGKNEIVSYRLLHEEIFMAKKVIYQPMFRFRFNNRDYWMIQIRKNNHNHYHLYELTDDFRVLERLVVQCD